MNFPDDQNGTLNETLNVSEDVSGDSSDKETDMRSVIDGLLFTAVLLLMLAMGCEMTAKQLLHHIKKPIRICIGMFGQFVVMPLSGFMLLYLTSTTGVQAAAVLITMCCPGGAVSNLLVYFCDGDICLSATLTSLSTLLAMGAMPLNLWMYGQNLAIDDVIIPYRKLGLSLVCVTSPVGVGMLVKWKFPGRNTAFFSKICCCISALSVITSIILESVFSPQLFTNIPTKLYAATVSFPVIGFSLNYLLAKMLRQNASVCRTIGLECGVQNVPIALAVVALTFPREIQDAIIPIPWAYCFTMLFGGFILICSYQVHKICVSRKMVAQEHSSKETDEDGGMLNTKDGDAHEPMLPSALKEPPVM